MTKSTWVDIDRQDALALKRAFRLSVQKYPDYQLIREVLVYYDEETCVPILRATVNNDTGSVIEYQVNGELL